MSITKTFARDMGRLAIDPDQAGLVAGYDMVPDGVTLEDKSGNGNDGVISGAAFEYTEIGPSMRWAGNSEDIVTTYTGAPAAFTICGWFNPRSQGEGGNFGRLLSKGSNVFELFISGTAVNIRYDNGSGVQNTGVGDGYVLNQEQHICLTCDSGSIKYYLNHELLITIPDNIVLSAAALMMGNYTPGNRAFDGNISFLKFYERALTAAEIQAEYQAGAKAINWKSDYGVDVSIAAESTPGELSNSVARIESGSHIMTTDTINGKTCKVIECVTAGVVQIPTAHFHGDDTQAAHGTFEWWMNKPGAGNEIVVGFIANQATDPAAVGFNGYAYRFSASERIQLYLYISSVPFLLNQTIASYANIGEWYKVSITRKPNGEFTHYINDLLVDMTGGFGTNPITDDTHTTSKHVVMDLDAGDKIAWAAPNGECAITKYQGVV